MKLWTTLSDDAIYDIADSIGVAIACKQSVNRGRPIIDRTGTTTRSARTFSLRPDVGTRDSNGDYRYQRTSASPFHPDRRVFAVCWHGHRDFMSAIFEADPDAKIQTMWATYDGRADFVEKYPDTAYKQIGPPIYPITAAEACKCGEW